MRVPQRPPFIPDQYNYRAILQELTDISRFEEFIDINDNKYPYWEKWKYIAREWNFDEKKLWAAVQSVRVGARQIKLTGIEGFSFKMSVPSVVQNYLHGFDLFLGGSLQGESIIPAEDRERYLISSLMEEAIASSQLEGAATTRKVAKEMLENNRKPRNASEQMILNNYNAMKWIVENKDVPLTVDTIKELHVIITQNTLSDPYEEGTFRLDDQVKVVDVQTGSTIHHPPAYVLLTQLMQDFCQIANDKDKQNFFIHPILKGIFLHFLIGYIHPFSDGNGRTARTIFYWYLLKKGYWLIEYMSVSRVILGAKAQYMHAYLHTELDENDLTYFFIYNLKCIQTALDDLKRYIQRKVSERKDMLALLRNTSFNDRQISILQELVHDTNSYFTVVQVQTKFSVSNQTARNDLEGLVEQGLLDNRRSGKKMQFYPVKDFINKLKNGMGK